jgi:hypothetical protein
MLREFLQETAHLNALSFTKYSLEKDRGKTLYRPHREEKQGRVEALADKLRPAFANAMMNSNPGMSQEDAELAVENIMFWLTFPEMSMPGHQEAHAQFSKVNP